MSRRNQCSRPLPALPLYFSTNSVGGNIQCVEGGRSALWTQALQLGQCALAAPLLKGDSVCVDVTGTGYFTVQILSRQLSEAQLQSTQTLSRDASLGEVKFKLKKSEFHIRLVRTSRTSVHILSTNADGLISRFEVKVPLGVDPWLTFNVLFGLLTFSSHVSGKTKKEWVFSECCGLNMMVKNKLEATSRLYNPCSLVATERAVGQGESVVLAVQPDCPQILSYVKVYLTNALPHTLHFRDHQAYFEDIYSSLYLVYEVKRLQGLLKLQLNSRTRQLEFQREDHGKRELRSAQCTRQAPDGIDLNKSVFVCLELFRVRVDIVQAADSPRDIIIGPDPDNTSVKVLASVPILPARSNYLTPVAAADRTPAAPSVRPRAPRRPQSAFCPSRVSTPTSVAALVHAPPPEHHPQQQSGYIEMSGGYIEMSDSQMEVQSAMPAQQSVDGYEIPNPLIAGRSTAARPRRAKTLSCGTKQKTWRR